MDDAPSLHGLLSSIVLRELQKLDAASKAECMDEKHLKALEVLAKILKGSPELAEVDAPPIAVVANIEDALTLVGRKD